MKKDYQKPMLISEEFIPNEYVAACYNFKALFHCHYGENNTNNHGKPCATTYVDINGIHATGHEGTIEKWGIPILNIVNPEKPDVPLNKNDAFQKVQKRRVQEKR